MYDGAAATPSIRFRNDPDTGIYRDNSEIRFSVGSNLRLGIGTDIMAYTNLSMGNKYIWGLLQGNSFTVADLSFYNDLNTGIVGQGADHYTLAAGGQRGVEIKKRGSYIHVGINTWTDTTYRLNLSGAAYKSVGGSYWNSTSDDRLKTNVESIQSGLSVIESLNPVSYNWNDKWLSAVPEAETHTLYGYLASEFQTVFPEDVIEGTTDLIKVDGEWKRQNLDEDEGFIIEESIEGIITINEGSIIPHLVAAVKELKDEIDALKEQIGG